MENVKCDVSISNNPNASDVILDEAQENNIDLIVMGRRAFMGIKRLIMGSVSSEVIDKAKCKVLMVPQDSEIKGKSVMLVVNGSDYNSVASHDAINICKRSPLLKTFTVVCLALQRHNIRYMVDNWLYNV